jgi:cobyrinic acid a,c-diamide synthase
MTRHGFLIAAPQSGSGKTTISLGIMAAMRKRGMKVAPFKCGPDFIDPGYHRLASGSPSINLDGWMCPLTFVTETFQLHSAKADVSIIEGVMGLFDGMGSSPMDGSSAQIAAVTGAPVVLVVNARGMAASAAALVKGFAVFDPTVKVAGVIFNNVGSTSHADLLQAAIRESLPGVAVLGCMPRDEKLLIPSRHLGLVTAEDNPLPQEFMDHLVAVCEQYLDIDGLARLEVKDNNGTLPPLQGEGRGGDGVDCVISASCQDAPHPPPNLPLERGGTKNSKIRIAVASDSAFCFVYEDNLRLLQEAGLEIVMFSPMNDNSLPDNISGIYLPGGYPELYAEKLTGNSHMRSAIRAAVENGMPVYAECGGFIYLTEGMESTEDAQPSDFVGVFPVRARMLPKRKALGYRQVELVADSVIAASGETARGHEFHYSEIAGMPEQIERCYMITRQGKQLGPEGYRYKNCLASYVHLHFGSNPTLAVNLQAACLAYQTGNQ